MSTPLLPDGGPEITGVSSTRKMQGRVGGKRKWGQRLEVYARSSYFTRLVKQLPCSHVIDLVYKKWGQSGGKPKFWGMPMPP